jgi:[ribosomal protein S18]-alanine N-acetyltransferase
LTREVTITAVSGHEAPALAAVHRRCFLDPWDASTFARLLEEPRVFCIAARSNEGLVGFVLCRVVCDESEILSCAVLPAHRRSGLGRRMLSQALDEARRRGVGEIFLEVAEDNEAAFALYTRSGFLRVGCRPAYFRGAQGRVSGAIMCANLRD